MAYYMGTDKYSCDFCGIEMDWDEADEKNGTMWECEECGKHFCSACFIKRHGKLTFDHMISEEEKVLCPDCHTEV